MIELNCTRMCIDMGNGYCTFADRTELYCMSDVHHSLSSLIVSCFGSDHINSTMRDKYSHYLLPNWAILVTYVDHSLHTVSWPLLNTLFAILSHKCSRRSSR